MLTMKVELWPLGYEEDARTLVTIGLANMGSDALYGSQVCNYLFTIDEDKPFGGLEPIKFDGKLGNYHRRATCVHMIAEIMDEYRDPKNSLSDAEKEVCARIRNKVKQSFQ